MYQGEKKHANHEIKVEAARVIRGIWLGSRNVKINDDVLAAKGAQMMKFHPTINEIKKFESWWIENKEGMFQPSDFRDYIRGLRRSGNGEGYETSFFGCKYKICDSSGSISYIKGGIEYCTLCPCSSKYDGSGGLHNLNGYRGVKKFFEDQDINIPDWYENKVKTMYNLSWQT